MLNRIRKMLKQQEGFTLVELMIVVVILGIISGIGIQQYSRVQERAREGVNDANLKMIASAVRMYHFDNNYDPKTVNDLEGYGLEKEPDTPWTGGKYVLTISTTDKTITISNDQDPRDPKATEVLPSLGENPTS